MQHAPNFKRKSKGSRRGGDGCHNINIGFGGRPQGTWSACRHTESIRLLPVGTVRLGLGGKDRGGEGAFFGVILKGKKCRRGNKPCWVLAKRSI